MISLVSAEIERYCVEYTTPIPEYLDRADSRHTQEHGRTRDAFRPDRGVAATVSRGHRARRGSWRSARSRDTAPS